MRKMPTNKPAYVIFTSGINDDPHDSDVAEVIGYSRAGLVHILFSPSADEYWAYPEELVAIP